MGDEKWKRPESTKGVEPDAIFDKTPEGLSQELQIDAVRRFDNHFKKLNESLSWMSFAVKISLTMMLISFLFSVILVIVSIA